jgi:hypothetical protein
MILLILPASSSIKPDAKIVGFLSLRDAIIVDKSTNLTPHLKERSSI